ncbi:MAG: hypothetical protein H6841_00520 [Planctomycetes bacterium]|nr:hypothetical protein [Planctomycetota bacterium]MCB9935872.1 hypothetical protein [Planctomycetota bacterium]
MENRQTWKPLLAAGLGFASLALAFLAIGTHGCEGGQDAGGGSGGTANVPPVTRPGPVPPSPPQPPIVLPAVIDAQDGHFRTHVVCSTCHTNAAGATAMRDSAAREIAPVNLWRATMMANSFRDPYFRAVLAAEKDHHPQHAALIEDTCLTCHAPQAAYEAHQSGGVQTLAELYTGATPRAQVGIDGVTCTLCHQVEPTGLGTPATYTAKFVISPNKVAYARHANPFSNPMVGTSGYTPTQASHTSQSKMCATCHTLHTPVLDLNNNITGNTFPEQAPYYEWRNSIFSTEAASPTTQAADCQTCHMPSVSQDGIAISTRIARRPAGDDFPPISPRQPYSRHSMIGGNTIMLSILRDRAADLNPAASAADFNHLIDRTRDLLENDTADVTITSINLAGGTLDFDVLVANRTGHKFPTSYLSRRAWLRVLVKDASGGVVWRSGDYDSAGRILDGANQPLASEAAHGPIQPHRQSISGQDEVQIYEAVGADVAGNATFSLLFCNSYYKDNRLLPQGWSDTHPDINHMRPQGVTGDGDFGGGSDSVHYQVSGLAAGSYTVEVQLLFQTISAREAAEVFLHDYLREVNVFRQYYEAAQRTPELIDEDTATTP